MYLADYWGAQHGQRGCYFALPTQATSDQMFTRIASFLRHRYPNDVVNLQLLHGHASLSAEFTVLQQNAHKLFKPEQIDAGDDANGQSTIVAAEWFTNRRRALLAPFGVGTVDQALLAVLQTKHGFVRLWGLAAKTVIVDEVHAYDTYMTTLLARLLEWLAALGTSVVLLSATLPRLRRQHLLGAFAKGAGLTNTKLPADAPYPGLSWVSAADTGSRPVETSSSSDKQIGLSWVDTDLGPRLRRALEGGGCAAVICNTVGRAQQVYQELKRYFPGEIDLLHARFLYKDRQEREKRVLERFGKTSTAQRPHRSVLVSTQIIEQSLDLDFDLMISDMAPVDLLLQRAGRLHRHQRSRPSGLENAELWIASPRVNGDGAPEFDPGTVAVYDPHVLLRSWLALHGRSSIAVPADIPEVIEAVYDERQCPAEYGGGVQAAWELTRSQLQQAVGSEQQAAAHRYIHHPGFAGLLSRLAGEPRAEDAPELHPAHQALTRLIGPSVRLVCMQAGDTGVSHTPSTQEAEELLRNSVTLTSRSVVGDLLAQEPPRSWQRSPLLRQHRLILFDSQSTAVCGTRRLKLDDELGVLILGRSEE